MTTREPMSPAAAPTTRSVRRPLRLADEPSERLFAIYAETRDRVVRDELVDRHRWLAKACARQMRRYSEPLDDLEQVALIGILKAIDRFDPSFGVQFKTYASATALGELRRHYRDTAWTMRIPRRVKDLHLRVQQAIDTLTIELARSPTPAELAQRLGVTVDMVLEAIDAADAFRPRPLVEENPGSGREMQADVEDGDFQQWLDRAEDRWTVRRLLASLDPRLRTIVVLRFFRHMTQHEIAMQIGMSQVQVSRLLRNAFAQMRMARDLDEIVAGSVLVPEGVATD